MESEERSELAHAALDGYAYGPGAPEAATISALQKVATSDAVIFVEGISDQMAIEELAIQQGRDLDAEGVAVLPVGGAHAIAGYLRMFGPFGEQLDLAGFCDADAADVFRRALATTGVGSPQTTSDMAKLGFFVCVEDLEDELIRAMGTNEVEAVLESQGDLKSFRRLQKQPEWRGRPASDQLRRFFRSRSSRNLRYARLLVRAVDIDRVPGPLKGALAYV